MAVSAEQRAGLWQAKLRALARDHLGQQGELHAAPWGAALQSDSRWTALIEQAPERSFGQAMVLGVRHRAKAIDLLIEGQAGAVARRARLFEPEPTVWVVEGADLVRAEPSVIEMVEGPTLPADIARLVDRGDLTVVAEHGRTTAEFLGLEVASVAGVVEALRLEVGVGVYDQGAFAVMHPDLTTAEALDRVVQQVASHRRRGAEPHPLNRLARERWLRAELLADPGRRELDSLAAIPPVTPRSGLHESGIASAIGTDVDGVVLIACAVGIDLDVVPAAADLAELHRADRIEIHMPARDHHPLIAELAARSRRPCTLVEADEPWVS